MNPFKGKGFGSIIIFILCSLCLFGCGSGKTDVPNMDSEMLNLNAGAVISSQEGEYKIFNYENGEYSKIDKEKIVLAYDKESSNYICIEDGMPYVVTNKKKFDITDEDYVKIRLSPGGKYVSYFLNTADEGLKFQVVDTDSEENITLDSNVIISGTFYDWYDENTLVYYGISEDGVNGIFTYNISENKEELKHKLSGSFVAYIKVCDNNIVYLESDFTSNKELKYIGETNEVNSLTNDIDEITDVMIMDGKYYYTGSAKGNVKSLYVVNNNKSKRIVYDFPEVIKDDKGLSLNNNELFFVGLDAENPTYERLYKCTGDETITSLPEKSKDFMFINYK